MALNSFPQQMKVVLEPSGTYGNKQPADGKTPDIAKATLPANVPQDANVVFSILTSGCVFVGKDGTISDNGATFVKAAVNGVVDDVEFTSSGVMFAELSAQVIDQPATQSTAEFYFTQVPAELDLQPPTATAIADGSDAVVVTATVLDSQKKWIKDVDVTFSVTDGGTLSSNRGRTNSIGRAMTVVTNDKAGTSTVTAQCRDVAPQHMTIQFTAVSHEPDHIGLKSEPAHALANSQDKIKITATVYDAKNGVIPDANVTFSVMSGTAVVNPINVTASDGAAVTYVTSGLAGTPQIKAISGNATPGFTTLDFDRPEVDSIQLAVNPYSAQPGWGQPTLTLTATVNDASGVKIPAGTVVFSDNSYGVLRHGICNEYTLNGAESEVDNGVATQTVASYLTGIFDVIATCNGKSSSPTTVRFQYELKINSGPSLLRGGDSGTVSGYYGGGGGKVLTITTFGLSAPKTCITYSDGSFFFDVMADEHQWGGSNGGMASVQVSDGIANASRQIHTK